jgi:hypothetical protein
MQEIWKDIEGYEKYYQVSNLGGVKSLTRKMIRSNGIIQTFKERILKPCTDTKGYLSVVLSKNNKANSFRIHRLVAKHFVPNIERKPQVNHIDGDKLNNNFNNLEWCTNKENQKHATLNKLHARGEKAGKSKLTEKQVIDIFQSKESTRKLGKKYNVHNATVFQIKNGDTWTDVTYKLVKYRNPVGSVGKLSREDILLIRYSNLSPSYLCVLFRVKKALISKIQLQQSYIEVYF